MEFIDHLVYATPDLQLGIDEIEAITGIRATIGGKHLNWGTWNALLSLGDKCFFEIIAIDPEQSDFQGPYIFKLDQIRKSKLVRWVAKSDHIPEQVAKAQRAGFSLGKIIDGQRKKEDGNVLIWSLTDPIVDPGNGLIPFLIDWQDTPHPGVSTPKGCNLVALSGTHPKPELIKEKLSIIGLDLDIERDSEIALHAQIKVGEKIFTIS